ncbi:EF-hand domain-containing protein [Thiorhodococcus mannitoliphagus]|uniref:EF-hand domain-containing protein n=1 Tax=Thiorhodococcus mannitoliphagus TaxID=329406 RepID=A0A6P1E2A2_9GAMM|nr:EF-hand domain-containing protein [Thiorhodococcus mannitoliphagus]NEX23206.1 EF-hand domain-containing protein [Thiorhodococcus mannitoliphagus]
MSSHISGLGGLSSMMVGAGATSNRPPPPPPGPSQLSEQMVSALDTDSKGYLDVEDIQSAVDQLTTEADASVASAEEVFAALDGDGDGQVTEAELAETFRTTAESLGLVQGADGQGRRPPPRPSSASSTSTASAESATNGNALMSTITQLMHTYGAAASSGEPSARFSRSA